MGPKISVWTFPRMFMPAPWMIRIFAMSFLASNLPPMLVDEPIQ
jgi:hypothetical protein